MSRDTTVIRLRQPDAIDDPLTELAREGARRMLATVLVAEADAFVALWNDVKLPDGRDRVVRHGYGPERTIQTGVGSVAVRRAKVRDRGQVGATEKIRFTSSILPKWARRTKSLDALLPILYLRGISTGDFGDRGRPEKPLFSNMVPGVGVEPTSPCGRRILSPLRLPFRHSGVGEYCGAASELGQADAFFRINYEK